MIVYKDVRDTKESYFCFFRVIYVYFFINELNGEQM